MLTYIWKTLRIAEYMFVIKYLYLFWYIAITAIVILSAMTIWIAEMNYMYCRFRADDVANL